MSDLNMKRRSLIARSMSVGWAVLPLVISAQAPPVTVPAITAAPISLNLSVGTTGSFTVAASGEGPLSFQWRRDGTNLPGATDLMLTVAALAANQGVYSVTVSNSAGSVESAGATL